VVVGGAGAATALVGLPLVLEERAFLGE